VRLVLIGLVAGFFSALFGVGGGIVIVPLLLLIGGWEARSATATSLAAIGITAVSGVIAYAIHGDVNVGYAALVGLPAAGSVAFATSLQQRLRSGTIELLFAGFMVAVAVWLFVKCSTCSQSSWASPRVCSPECSVSGAASSSFPR
jgi:uncharacterized membrane protein YfcA